MAPLTSTQAGLRERPAYDTIIRKSLIFDGRATGSIRTVSVTRPGGETFEPRIVDEIFKYLKAGKYHQTGLLDRIFLVRNDHTPIVTFERQGSTWKKL